MAGSPTVLRNAWQRTLTGMLSATTGQIERMPRAKALARGAALGRLGFRLAARPREYARRNLRLAYPDWSQAERDDLILRCFMHWGKVTMDFLKAPTYDREVVRQLVPSFEGYLEHARPFLDAGQGIIAVTGHLGSFEIFGRYVGLNAIPMTVVVRDPSDPVFAGYVRRLRESGGYKSVGNYSGLGLRELLRGLRRGEVVGILPDQNGADMFLPFFGVPAGTADGPSLLSYKTGAPIIPAFCVLAPDDTYKIIVRPPLWADRSLSRPQALRETAMKINAEIEWAVRQWPEQYLWLHNRYKGAFEEKYRHLWPEGYDYDALKARWQGERA